MYDFFTNLSKKKKKIDSIYPLALLINKCLFLEEIKQARVVLVVTIFATGNITGEL